MILAKTLKLVIFLKENHDFQEIEDGKKEKHRAKIDEKSHVFWDLDFERILGVVWERQILDFCSIFDVFSISFFKRGSEGEKIDQKFEKTKLFRFLASGLRWSPGRWGKERIGVRTLQIELRERMSRLASCDSTEPVGN